MTNSHDSNTFVLRSKVDRKVTSYRLDPLVTKKFKERVNIQGLSTCHVLEALQYAYIMSSPDNPVIDKPKFNVNLYLTREVTKRRRVGDLESEQKVVWRGSVDSCSECGGHPFYVGGHRADPFTYVKRYLCVDCFKFCRGNGEVDHWDRLKNTPYYFEPKESRVKGREMVKVSSGVGFSVEVKDFEDWIGIRVS